jgi:hypothetical protein
MRIMAIGAALLAAAAPAQESAPLTPGTVSVEVVDAQRQHPALDQMYVQAVGDALTDANFLILPGEGHGRYIARVTVTQEGRGGVAADSRSGGGARLSGGRLGVSLPSTRTQLSGLVVTRLDVSLALRETGQIVWSGSASTAQVQDTAAGAPATVAGKLAAAVIRRFPEKTTEPIAVP